MNKISLAIFANFFLNNEERLQRMKDSLNFFKDSVEKNILDSIPNKELFVAIDDDHDEPGYSLISRVMNPNRISKDSMKNIEFGYSNEKRKNLKFLFPNLIRPMALKVFRFLRSIFYTLNIFKN